MAQSFSSEIRGKVPFSPVFAQRSRLRKVFASECGTPGATMRSIGCAIFLATGFACVDEMPISWPPMTGERAMIAVAGTEDPRAWAIDLESDSREGANAFHALETDLELRAFLSDYTLAELQLAPGAFDLVQGTGRSLRAISRTAYVKQLPSGDWSPLDTTLDLLAQRAIPALNLTACGARDGCLDGLRCAASCGHTAPEAPREVCPWTLVDGICVPPDICDEPNYLFHGEEQCRRVPDDRCPPEGLMWHEDAPDDAIFVSPGALGNGKRETPFGSISEALEMLGTDSGTIALSKGTFDEKVIVPMRETASRITILGACSTQTVLRWKGGTGKTSIFDLHLPPEGEIQIRQLSFNGRSRAITSCGGTVTLHQVVVDGEDTDLTGVALEDPRDCPPHHVTRARVVDSVFKNRGNGVGGKSTMNIELESVVFSGVRLAVSIHGADSNLSGTEVLIKGGSIESTDGSVKLKNVAIIIDKPPPARFEKFPLIHVDGGTLTVEGLYLQTSLMAPLRISRSKGATITDLVIDGSEATGGAIEIQNTSERVQIAGARIQNTGGSGIFVTSNASASFFDLAIRAVEGAGLTITTTQSVIVGRSEIVSALGCGLDVTQGPLEKEVKKHTFDEIVIRQTRGPTGTGVCLRGTFFLDISDFIIEQNARVGVLLEAAASSSSQLQFSRGFVRNQTVGVRTTGDLADAAKTFDAVTFEHNVIVVEKAN